VEPLVSKQWYVRTKPLAEPAIKAVRSGKIKIVPRTWSKTYFHWMENIRDWAISRQLWWGHRIPVWYCDKDGSMHVSRTDLAECPRCKGPLRQDTDVLDTWFSSGLWPFSTLGWPESTPELKVFYPTSVLSTGFDILFFWVARMAMLGIKFMGDVPFHHVYIHALVRDADGQKMSKSKGNVVDPLSVMDRYGTDAFRFTLAALAAQGRDIRLTEERIEGYRNFANKIWNAARLVLTNLEGYDPARARRGTPSVADRWIKSRLTEAIAEVRKAIDTYRFNDAASAVYQFLWHEYCDWYLEIAKRSLYQPESPEAKAVTQRTLVETLETTLRLLHPFMPFISEELWQRLPHTGESIPAPARSIMIAPFPKATRKGRDAEAERLMAPVLDFVSAIRTVRSESRISPAVELAVTVKPAAPAVAAALQGSLAVIGSLARAAVTVSHDGARAAGSAVATTPSGDVFVRLEGVVDFEAERQRLRKEIERSRKEITFLEGKLGRPDFVERAPAEVVERERERLAEQRQIEQKLTTSLAALE
jgi:valyl-tRNA synthetase